MKLKPYMIIASLMYVAGIGLAFLGVALSRRPDGWEALYPPVLTLAVVLAYGAGIYGESRKCKSVLGE